MAGHADLFSKRRIFIRGIHPFHRVVFKQYTAVRTFGS